MPARDLLIIRLGDDPRWETPTLLSSTWKVTAVHDLAQAGQALKRHRFPVGLLLLGADPNDTLAALDGLLEAQQSTQWLGVFAPDMLQHEGYRRLIVQHLFDFHTWPIDTFRLMYSLGHAHGYAAMSAGAHAHERTMQATAPDMELVGQSAAIVRLRQQIAKVAQVNANVLIWGESGSGKELVARAIHQHSSRAQARFVAMNCAAVPAGLVQSELFGYTRGAFTGANRDKAGVIESAAGGTLFLDEIGDLMLELQANFLRFLQEGTITRVGSANTTAVDVRIIAASHVRLEDAVRAGQFREDLLYRLNVLPLSVPALRERKEDLPILMRYFFHKFGHDKNPRLSGFSNRATLAMQQHDWPGNVRELINRIRRAMVMSEGRLITPEDLGLRAPGPAGPGDALEDARVRAECDAIVESLHGNGFNKTRAARKLGVSRMTLYRLMDKHGIQH